MEKCNQGVVETTLTMLIHKRANRQYIPMIAEDVWPFIESREKLYVAFPMENGYPHVSPMWFCVLDKRMYLRTHDYKVKARLARIGKACCTLDDGSQYKELRGVVIWGRCRLVTDIGTIERINRIMAMKYKVQQWKSSEMPEWWVKERKAEKRAYIEINPTKISSWDNRKL